MSRDAVAVLVEVVFAALAFGWRSWVQWRRTGSSGFVRPRRDAPAVEKAGSAAFVVSLALLAAAPWVDDPTVTFLRPAAVGVVGVTVGVVGVVVCLAAQLTMGASWRIGVDPEDRTDLVTAGVFRHVRNPIFTSMLVTAVGLALTLADLLSAVGAVALAVGLHLQVRHVEEPYLLRAHADAYRRYAARTGRFVPGLGRMRLP